jgi:hypothetical protein
MTMERITPRKTKKDNISNRILFDSLMSKEELSSKEYQLLATVAKHIDDPGHVKNIKKIKIPDDMKPMIESGVIDEGGDVIHLGAKANKKPEK